MIKTFQQSAALCFLKLYFNARLCFIILNCVCVPFEREIVLANECQVIWMTDKHLSTWASTFNCMTIEFYFILRNSKVVEFCFIKYCKVLI